MSPNTNRHKETNYRIVTNRRTFENKKFSAWITKLTTEIQIGGIKNDVPEP